MKLYVCVLMVCSAFFFQDAISDKTAEAAAAGLMKQLGGRLKAGLQEGGPAEAIRICNVEAMPITGKVSKEQGLTLSRITDRPRNPKNLATASERDLMDLMRADLEKKALKPLYRLDGAVYKPLLIQPVCLTCHGENLPPQVADKIAESYPVDRAVGYRPGQLRGAIKVARNP
ncbi:DUF3365 domain-containing protein [Sulfidibacter corallicola]|uniref:DUF3365 domain-containing protein n=1 Tax=Sulfidibacter corallicola TaxID=2818388 RepID=A0A8A4TKR1_SULCO|nr:DUF3365 domain-containing protein [Sulfidibacter corallicola]QTD49471.1 DUF3365 domain-containing protein [Sulfidibacter corallicola]